MKRILIAIALIALLATKVWAVGSVTQTPTDVKPFWRIVTFSWTADSGDGTVPATATDDDYSALLCMVVTNPGSTAPTSLYNATITDSTNSFDVMGGAVNNRSATVTEQEIPTVGSGIGCRPVNGTLTLNIVGNSVNSATGTVELWIYIEQGVGE